MFDWRLQMFIERGCCRNCLVYHKLAGLIYGWQISVLEPLISLINSVLSLYDFSS